MNFICIKRGSAQLERTDTRWIYFRHRRTFRSLPYEDTYVRKTQDIWLLGPPQCGKSRAMQQLIDKGQDLWRRWPMLQCQSNEPISRWTSQPALASHLQGQGVEIKKMGVEARIDALLAWVKEKEMVLLIDDAHALSGRKLDLMVRLAQNARVVVMGAISEQALHPSLRTCLQRRSPQVLIFRSETPYDATVTLVCILLLMALAAGWYELAAALTTARALGHGPLASRQR